jgi:hypothetical protein
MTARIVKLIETYKLLQLNTNSNTHQVYSCKYVTLPSIRPNTHGYLLQGSPTHDGGGKQLGSSSYGVSHLIVIFRISIN